MAGVHFGPAYESLAASLQAGGPGRLLVVTDFDQTLTTFGGSDGASGLQCHDMVLRLMDLDRRVGLRERMAPLIEWNDMPEEERMQICGGNREMRAAKSRWFFEAFAAVCCDFDLLEQVDECLAQCNTQVRCGLAQTFEWLEACGVPLIVVSAGLIQLLKGVLVAGKAQLPSQTRIVANDLTDPRVTVTSRSKSTALGAISDFDAIASGRDRVLLLGDKPADCAVVDGLPAECKVLKVCFKEPSELRRSEVDVLLEHFDVVLTGDADMSFVNNLLYRISGAPGAPVAE
mmetsp:Transcript_103195/g.291398  ORF Transcript_103195/g.291398 Transcript_103195/m.291398 type:complete len:288 (+) Transcript_103195:152-1015(+)